MIIYTTPICLAQKIYIENTCNKKVHANDRINVLKKTIFKRILSYNSLIHIRIYLLIPWRE